MSEFRVTFGQKYLRETHPMWAGASPDGWLSIDADSHDEARGAAVRMLGTAWSDIGAAKDDDHHWYARGELHRVSAAHLDFSAVSVCAECMSGECWAGELMCEGAKGAGMVSVPAWQASDTKTQRAGRAGEVCECGRPATTTTRTSAGVVAWCGLPVMGPPPGSPEALQEAAAHDMAADTARRVDSQAAGLTLIRIGTLARQMETMGGIAAHGQDLLDIMDTMSRMVEDRSVNE